MAEHKSCVVVTPTDLYEQYAKMENVNDVFDEFTKLVSESDIDCEDLSALKGTASALKDRNLELKTKVTTKDTKIKKLKSTLSQLEASQSEKENEILAEVENFQQENENLAKTLEQMKAKVELESVEHAKVEAENTLLTRKLATVKFDHQEILAHEREHVSALEKENLQLFSTVDGLEKKITEKDAEIFEKTGQIDDLTEEINQLTLKLEENEGAATTVDAGRVDELTGIAATQQQQHNTTHNITRHNTTTHTTTTEHSTTQLKQHYQAQHHNTHKITKQHHNSHTRWTQHYRRASRTTK